MRSRHGLKASFWLLVLFWVNPHPVKDFCMTQGLPFTWHYNSAWIQLSAFCSHPRSFSTYNILLQQFLVRSARGSWQYPTYRTGSDAQAEDLGTKPREKGKEEAVCGCQLREALEAFCLQGAQHLLREITHRGAACSPGAAQPLTVDVGSLCHHFLPSQEIPCLFPLTQAPEGPQETKTQLCIPAGHCLLPRAFPSIC